MTAGISGEHAVRILKWQEGTGTNSKDNGRHNWRTGSKIVAGRNGNKQ
jgi:hypothetical protein